VDLGSRRPLPPISGPEKTSIALSAKRNNHTKNMFKKLPSNLMSIMAGATALAFVQTAAAQTFKYQVADLLLTLRKTGVYAENYEVVVNLGQASNYVNAAIGSHMTITKFSASQLVPGSFTTFDNLSWAVTGDYQGATYAGYPNYTLWVTVPRSENGLRSSDATRLAFADQNTVRSKIDSILGGASYISKDLGTSNQFNTFSLVREYIGSPPNYSTHSLSVWMASVVDNTIGTLNDTWPSSEPNSGNLENTTPTGFSGTVRSDLYEVRPSANAAGTPIVDPHTGTSGLAYYVGYFELGSDGTLTFNRQAASTPPPAPQIVSAARSGNTSTVYFTTANGATYTLFYTNLAGLTAPVSTWPSSPATLTGNGSVNSLSDTTTDAGRFYKVGAR
jgi:hypothetical protein